MIDAWAWRTPAKVQGTMSLLSPLPAPLTLNWLFDEGSLTRRLTRLSDDGFSVTPLFEGWQPLRDDECATLDLPAASIGWVREVYLRGHGQPWVFARSVAARSALQGDGLHMDELGSRYAATHGNGCPRRTRPITCGHAARASTAGR
eukprot:gene23391-35834_t